MTLKQTLKLIFGGIFAFILTLLGIQRKTIVKQKEEIKEKKAEIVTKEAQVEASQDLMKTNEALDIKQDEQKEKIQEANNEQEALEEINVILRDFNKRSRN
jgi:predicted nuclease with TOPRIM domain